MSCGVFRSLFGRTGQGAPVHLFTVVGDHCRFSVSEYGAALVSLLVRDRSGQFRDVVLGFDSAAGYERDQHCLGVTLGRIAGVVSRARFSLNGISYPLENSGSEHFHGGPSGFSRQLWQGEAFDAGVRMNLHSPSLSGGYPGSLVVSVTFRLENDSCLAVHYAAVSDADTYLNLSNHAYFNLNGHGSGACGGHLLRVRAGRYIPVGRDQVPLGRVCPAAGTPFDFREWRPIGGSLVSPCRQIRLMGGIDHYLVLDGDVRPDTPAAQLLAPASGIRLSLSTTKPGLYLYTGNSLDESGLPGKHRRRYERFAGVALEPQYYPDGPNQPGFVCPVLKAGEPYCHVTKYDFAVSGDCEKMYNDKGQALGGPQLKGVTFS